MHGTKWDVPICNKQEQQYNNTTTRRYKDMQQTIRQQKPRLIFYRSAWTMTSALTPFFYRSAWTPMSALTPNIFLSAWTPMSALTPNILKECMATYVCTHPLFGVDARGQHHHHCFNFFTYCFHFQLPYYILHTNNMSPVAVQLHISRHH